MSSLPRPGSLEFESAGMTLALVLLVGMLLGALAQSLGMLWWAAGFFVVAWCVFFVRTYRVASRRA